jgi:uncharacterized membrane protein (DUF373 family)
MADLLKKFENIIINSLVVLMALVIFLSTVRLVGRIFEEMLNPPFLLLDSNQLLDVFGFFFIILIGLELLESIRVYEEKEVIRVEIILSIALIAVARKVITIDVSTLSGLSLLGISSVILSLAVGYFLIRKAHINTEKK